jgi:hypothetical protein
MDGARLRAYWSAEVDAMLATYRQFERLVPSSERAGSAHPGEDGRYVEALLRSYLKAYLPRDLEVLTGFVLRAATISGQYGYERESEQDQQSSQLDLLIYDSASYPVYQRFGENVIVPPEGVVAIVSVKKHLSPSDVRKEVATLRSIARLCRCINGDGLVIRGPFLGLVGMGWIPDRNDQADGACMLPDVRDTYASVDELTFDEIIGFFGVLDGWSVTKRRPPKVGQPMEARLERFVHGKADHHLGLQFLLSGILSVYYDDTRMGRSRPAFTAFESGRSFEEQALVSFHRLR